MPSGDNSPCRIASFSGFMGDRYDALKTQTETGTGILFGDYLAEMVGRSLRPLPPASRLTR